MLRHGLNLLLRLHKKSSIMRNILVDIQEVKCMGKKIVAVILSVALRCV